MMTTFVSVANHDNVTSYTDETVSDNQACSIVDATILLLLLLPQVTQQDIPNYFIPPRPISMRVIGVIKRVVSKRASQLYK